MKCWYNKETAEKVWFKDAEDPGHGFTEKEVKYLHAVWDVGTDDWKYVVPDPPLDTKNDADVDLELEQLLASLDMEDESQ
jgi:hypothetical protein